MDSTIKSSLHSVLIPSTIWQGIVLDLYKKLQTLKSTYVGQRRLSNLISIVQSNENPINSQLPGWFWSSKSKQMTQLRECARLHILLKSLTDAQGKKICYS